MKAKAEKGLERGEALGLVFEGVDGKPLSDIRASWAAVCQKAGLGQFSDSKDKTGKPVKVWQADARMHDLRHTYASILASQGLSLPIIGQLLGHTQAQTTQRYAHLMDDPLRAATERVGAVVAGSALDTTATQIGGV
jgi:integrase